MGETRRARRAWLVFGAALLLVLAACGDTSDGAFGQHVVTEGTEPRPEEPDQAEPEPEDDEPAEPEDDRSPEQAYADALEATLDQPGGLFEIHQDFEVQAGITYTSAVEGGYSAAGAVEAEMSGAATLGFVEDPDSTVLVRVVAGSDEVYLQVEDEWLILDEESGGSDVEGLGPLGLLDDVVVDSLEYDGEGEAVDGGSTRRYRGEGTYLAYETDEGTPADLVVHVDEDGLLRKVVVAFDEIDEMGGSGQMVLLFVDFGEQPPVAAPEGAITMDEWYGYDDEFETITEGIY
jgi:hypothetical protein